MSADTTKATLPPADSTTRSSPDTQDQDLLTKFPNLDIEGFQTICEPTTQYNCVAYAVGDHNKPWWPTGFAYWPPWATPDTSMENVENIFTSLGYERCHDSGAEDSYQKVALYGNQGQFDHVALQMPNGAWRSKMGHGGPVIEHRNPESLSGGMYGNPTTFMRRKTG